MKKPISEIDASSIFITGGTGFIGKGLLRYIEANNLTPKLTLLSRDPEKAKKKFTELKLNLPLNWIRGSIEDLPNINEKFDYMIHMAASPFLDRTGEADLGNPSRESDLLIQICERSSVKKLLFFSSGGVYEGPSTSEDSSQKKPYDCPPYIAHKIVVEQCLKSSLKNHSTDLIIARGFTFGGPFVPLMGPYAVSQFTREAISDQKITIIGDGNSRRSYLDSVETGHWLLWTLLNAKKSAEYNIGSDFGLTVLDVANIISNRVSEKIGKPVRVEVQGMSDLGLGLRDYVPDLSRTKTDLGLKPEIDSGQVIQSTVDWIWDLHRE